MLENLITLHVDHENNATLSDEVYRRYDTSIANKTVYVLQDLHSLLKRFTMSVFRTPPKRVGNFKGTAKSAVKFTQDIDVPGVDSTTTLTVPLIAEASFSLPLGCTSEQALAARQRLIAYLDNEVAALHIELLEV
jgi:hypothetical protein